MATGFAGAFAFLIKSLALLFIGALIVRFLLQWARASFANPGAQFLLRLTHPVVRPFRRIIPPIGSIDLAMLVVILGLIALTIAVLSLLLRGGVPSPAALALITLGTLLHMVVNIYIGAIIIMVIFSWISPGGYHPVAMLVDSLTDPLMRPVRGMLPTAGGIDFSPMLVMILLFFVKRLLIGGFGLGALWHYGL